MEANYEASKFAAQAKELLTQHCLGKMPEEVDGVLTAILLLEKAIDALLQTKKGG